VANAGVGAGGSAEQLSIDDFREAMEVNFYGVLRVTKAALPQMRARGSGRLIAVSSVAGAFGQPFNDAYCAAKCAVEGLYESLRPVAAQFGVHVSIVEPGPVATAFADKRLGLSPSVPPADDDPYAPMWGRYLAFMAAGGDRAQSVDDAAKAIVEVCNAPDPLLRYQTSRFTSRLIGMKLADLNGSVISDFTSTWIAEPAP
jgi:NAD(P)-dependent dehydrogenase (short-subunit alcohol dehydrogenase family)